VNFDLSTQSLHCGLLSTLDQTPLSISRHSQIVAAANIRVACVHMFMSQ